MNREKAIQKRQDFVIKKLHEIDEIRKLSEFSKKQALERAKEMQTEMATNIAPLMVWQKAINTLIKEIE